MIHSMVRAAKRAWTRAASATARTVERMGIAALGRHVAGWWFSPARGSKEWLQEMGANALLFTVCNRIATDISGVAWHVYQRSKSDPKQRDEVSFDHELVTLLEQPNDWHTGEELMYLVEAYLDLCGEAFLLIIRDDRGRPVQLLPLPPHWVLTPPTRMMQAFEVLVRDKIEWVPESEIIWVKNPHPFEPYGRGLGTSAALDNQVSQAKSADLHNLNFFRRNARPDVIVSVQDAEIDQLKRVKEDWLSKHKGVIDQWEPEFINGDTRVQLLTQSIKDMDFVNLRKSIRDTVFQTYGVPPEVLGIVENSNRATADLAIYLYTLLVLTPRLKRIRSALQRRLVSQFGDPLLVLDFESPVRETAEFRLKQAGDLFSRSIISRNEARKIVGEAPVVGTIGDEFLQPVNVVAMDRDGNPIVVGPNSPQGKKGGKGAKKRRAKDVVAAAEQLLREYVRVAQMPAPPPNITLQLQLEVPSTVVEKTIVVPPADVSVAVRFPGQDHEPNGQFSSGKEGNDGGDNGTLTADNNPYDGWMPNFGTPTATDFISARDQSSRVGYLTPLTEDDLAGHKMFLSSDQKVGASVSPEGDICNVFNNGGPKGAGTEAVLMAMSHGGVTLDCYSGYLPEFYTQFGFSETGRMAFDREQAPPAWKTASETPDDLVFMAHTHEVAHDEVRDRVVRKQSQWIEGTVSERRFDDYDQAKAESRRAVLH